MAYSSYEPHSIINRKPHPKNPGGGATNVEIEHLPAWKQIENVVAAGERLAAYRKENYHFGYDEEIPEGWYDPTLERGFDLTAAEELLSGISDRRLKQEAIAEARKASEEADAQSANVAEEGNMGDKQLWLETATVEDTGTV